MSISDSAELVERRQIPASGTEVALYGIYEISKLLTTPARLEATLAQVLSVLSNFLEMQHGLIAFFDEEGAPELVVGTGTSPASAKRYFQQLPEQVIGRVVVTQMPLLVENMREDPLFEGSEYLEWASGDAQVAFIGVPIKDRGKVIGTITIDRENRGGEQAEFRFDDDVRFLTMVANLLGQTVRLQRFTARDRDRLIEEQHRLSKVIESAPAVAGPSEGKPFGIIGDSAAIRTVLQKTRLVARSHSTVLLRGESGTGKELFARALHDLSPRSSRAFVTLNCAALPESVLESELFGHEKGAFTGAVGLRRGRFELADGGTLFLDEIGEISALFQAKLLRVLQLGEFERVGGTQTLKVDVRLVAATNRNLEDAVARGGFRADLYYRISVVPILLPPLRERASDIPMLAREFLERFNTENGTCLYFADAAMSVLGACSFPGNVRELENCVRRTATLAAGATIVANDFACRHDECLSSVLWKGGVDAPHGGFVPLPIGRSPRRFGNSAPARFTTRAPSPRPSPSSAPDPDSDDSVEEDWAMPVIEGSAGMSERERLIEVMESAGWVQAKAARILGLSPRQVGYALRKHEIPIKKF
jgi:Nif-specific regulatory protein